MADSLQQKYSKNNTEQLLKAASRVEKLVWGRCSVGCVQVRFIEHVPWDSLRNGGYPDFLVRRGAAGSWWLQEAGA